MRLILLVAAASAFVLIALRVPPEARDWGYWLNGFALLCCLGLLAQEPDR